MTSAGPAGHSTKAPASGLGLWARYRAVWAAAWAERKRLDGVPRGADELDFLPAALSLQETPPHPVPRLLAWLLMALFIIALAWACLGRVDIVAIAPGRIVVSDRTKVIQPLEPSVVRQVLVKDGDHVDAGQVLVELDPTLAKADRSSVRTQYLAALSDELRAGALLKAMVFESRLLSLPSFIELEQENQI